MGLKCGYPRRGNIQSRSFGWEQAATLFVQRRLSAPLEAAQALYGVRSRRFAPSIGEIQYGAGNREISRRLSYNVAQED